MTMNAFLADMYNTAENIGAGESAQEDRAKLAQMQILSEVAATEGLNLDDLSDDDVVKIANKIWGEGHGISKEAMGNLPPEFMQGKGEDKGKDSKKEEEKKGEGGEMGEEDAKKEAKAKMAEAELMGRLMAHAMINELSLIDKTAADKNPKSPSRLEKLASVFGKNEDKGKEGLPQSAIEKVAAAYKARVEGKPEADSDDLEKEAEERAIGFLRYHGIDVDKDASPEEKAKQAKINELALKKLKEAGFTVAE